MNILNHTRKTVLVHKDCCRTLIGLTLVILAFSQGIANLTASPTKITAADKAADDGFGRVTAISGIHFAVGAAGADPNGLSNAGAVYLHRLEANGSATLLHKVTAADRGAGDEFGTSISLSGNLLAVGAYYADPDGVSDAGAAYLYRIEVDESLSFLTKVSAPDKSVNDRFGNSISMHGNVLAVGAYLSDPEGLNAAGAVYLFQLESNGTCSFLAKVSAPDKAESDTFGEAVSMYGNLLAVGANYADPDGVSNAGAAYVFRLEDNGSVSFVSKLTAPDKSGADEFGAELSFSKNMLAVGAWSSDPRVSSPWPQSPGGGEGGESPSSDRVSNAGAVYLFQLKTGESDHFRDNFVRASQNHVTLGYAGSPGQLIPLTAFPIAISKVTAPDKASGDHFGSRLCLHGDFLSVGANSSDPDGVDYSGSAYLFKIHDYSVTSYLGKFSAEDKAVNDRFGTVAHTKSSLLVGSSRSDPDGVSDAGAVYSFDISEHSTPQAKPNKIVELNSTVGLEMIWVEPGTFTMGSPTGETGRSSPETEHNVTLTKGFYLGKYEVTQAQYEAVMTGNTNSLSPTPSNWSGNPNRPVETVSWDDVQIFLTRLNSAEQAAGRLPAGWSYVLPTESQWEYACRAGTTTAYSWGNTIASSNANYNHNIGQTVYVGQYAANPWGFFDMHGNVYEWTADRYGIYPTGNPVIDPTGPASGSIRVTRGGSWDPGGSGLRSAWRSSAAPSYRFGNLGFRVGFLQQ